jgi:hypothetical protein
MAPCDVRRIAHARARSVAALLEKVAGGLGIDTSRRKLYLARASGLFPPFSGIVRRSQLSCAPSCAKRDTKVHRQSFLSGGLWEWDSYEKRSPSRPSAYQAECSRTTRRRSAQLKPTLSGYAPGSRRRSHERNLRQPDGRNHKRPDGRNHKRPDGRNHKRRTRLRRSSGPVMVRPMSLNASRTCTYAVCSLMTSSLPRRLRSLARAWRLPSRAQSPRPSRLLKRT